MPYSLTFSGNFFHIADFIKGIDSLVHTGGRRSPSMAAWSLSTALLSAPTREGGFPHLNANFAVTTYIHSTGQGVTAGATADRAPRLRGQPCGNSIYPAEATATEPAPAEPAQ